MTNTTVSVADVKSAHLSIGPHICTTPVLNCAAIDEQAQRCIYLKAECLQVTGSFKIRGATNAVQLSLKSKGGPASAAGVYTHSSGNHGAALAHAARSAGTSATIIMPRTAPACKVAAARSAGATVVMCEPTMAGRQEAAASHAQKHPQDTFIPPYNHPHIIAGQGTIALELLKQVMASEIVSIGTPGTEASAAGITTPPSTAHPIAVGGGGSTVMHSTPINMEVRELDAVLVPVSGGGLISGISSTIKALAPNCMVIGAEPLGTNNMADAAACKAAGELVQLSAAPDTIADGLKAALGDITWPIVRDNVDAIIPVSEEAILSAMRLLMDKTKLVVEPSGATALAAVLSEPFVEQFGSLKQVAVILSGGNVDFDRVQFWQQWGEHAGVDATS